MVFEPKSIEEHIECLARLTGAPASFVGQVKSLFATKGISLAEDATPYLTALEEAFRREESIRANSQRARESVSRVENSFNTVGREYVKQLDRLKQVQSSLRGGEGRKSRGSAKKVAGNELRIPGGDHRTYITAPQKDQMPMVPGPTEDQ